MNSLVKIKGNRYYYALPVDKVTDDLLHDLTLLGAKIAIPSVKFNIVLATFSDTLKDQIGAHPNVKAIISADSLFEITRELFDADYTLRNIHKRFDNALDNFLASMSDD